MDVLLLSDGTTVNVGNTRDFSDLIDQKLGLDAKHWFDDFVSGYEHLQSELLSLNDDFLDDLK